MTTLEQAKQFYKEKKYSEATEAFLGLLDLGESEVESYFYLGNIYHVKGELGKAIKSFSKVLELDPGHTDASISLSILYNDIGRYEMAQTVFDKANRKIARALESDAFVDKHLNKKFASRHEDLAELYLSHQRFDEALFEFNKAISLNPDEHMLKVKVAKVYAKKGFIEKAIDELLRVKNSDPSFLPARMTLGVLYYGQGRVIEAQDEWKKVLVKDPGNEEAAMYLNLSQTATETSL